MCSIGSGVLQGCPLAALLSVMAMEPFCILSNRQINAIGLGCVRLCADDIGIVLNFWHSLIIIFKIFYLAERCACLKLSIKKCFLVPLSRRLTPHVIGALMEFLISNISSWAKVNISSSAEYLGIWFGPKPAPSNGQALFPNFCIESGT